MTWPCWRRSTTLPTAPPMTSAKGSAVRQSPRGVRASQKTSSPLIANASTVKNQVCQPPASARKLNAAPAL